MSDDPLIQNLLADPTTGANPFSVLAAPTEADSAAVAERARRMQLRAVDEATHCAVRDAVSELRGDALRRATWELFTPHIPPEPDSTSAGTTADRLGRFLLGGASPHDSVSSALLQLVALLGWEEQRCRKGLPEIDQELMAKWWAAATHRHQHNWRFRHVLALIYHAQACAAERVQLPREQSCSTGRGSDVVDSASIDPLWMRTFACWERATAEGELWDQIRTEIAEVTGYTDERFDAFREDWPRELVGSLIRRIEAAVNSRNRLAVARHARYLATLQSAEFPILAPLAGELLDELKYSLWANVERGVSASEQFDELAAGLLILFPDDLRVVRRAFDLMLTTGNREQADGSDDFPASTRMACHLANYDEGLSRSVFAAYPSPQPVNPDSPKHDLLLMQWYYLLRRDAHDAPPHTPVADYARAVTDRLAELKTA